MPPSRSGSTPPTLEELTTLSAAALVQSWIYEMAADGDITPREITVFLHQSTRSISIMEGPPRTESPDREVDEEARVPPASEAFIDSMPRVQVTDPGVECSICLSGYEVGDESEGKEMPCGHIFHSGCIDTWLGIHGSCPICRFTLPVEEEEEEEDEEEDEDERVGAEEGGGWRIHVVFAREVHVGPDTGTDLDPGDDVGENGGAGLPPAQNEEEEGGD